MATFEFTNHGIERHYSDSEASESSLNPQFEPMELEDIYEVGNKIINKHQCISNKQTPLNILLTFQSPYF